METLLYLTSELVPVMGARDVLREIVDSATEAECALVCNFIVGSIGLPERGPWSKVQREKLYRDVDRFSNKLIRHRNQDFAKQDRDAWALNRALGFKLFVVLSITNHPDGSVEMCIGRGQNPLVLNRYEQRVREFLAQHPENCLRLGCAPLTKDDRWITSGGGVDRRRKGTGGTAIKKEGVRPVADSPIRIVRGIRYQETPECSVITVSGGGFETQRRRH